VIDTVTGRRASLHAEIAETLEAMESLAWDSPTKLVSPDFSLYSLNAYSYPVRATATHDVPYNGARRARDKKEENRCVTVGQNGAER